MEVIERVIVLMGGRFVEKERGEKIKTVMVTEEIEMIMIRGGGTETKLILKEEDYLH